MGFSITQIEEYLEERNFKSKLDTESETNVAIIEHRNHSFWLYFLEDEKDDTNDFDALIFSYIGDTAPSHLGWEQINEFHDGSYFARLFLDDERQVNLNAKLMFKESDLTENIFSNFFALWQFDYEDLIDIIENKAKG